MLFLNFFLAIFGYFPRSVIPTCFYYSGYDNNKTSKKFKKTIAAAAK